MLYHVLVKRARLRAIVIEFTSQTMRRYSTNVECVKREGFGAAGRWGARICSRELRQRALQLMVCESGWVITMCVGQCGEGVGREGGGRNKTRRRRVIVEYKNSNQVSYQ